LYHCITYRHIGYEKSLVHRPTCLEAEHTRTCVVLASPSDWGYLWGIQKAFGEAIPPRAERSSDTYIKAAREAVQTLRWRRITHHCSAEQQQAVAAQVSICRKRETDFVRLVSSRDARVRARETR